MYRYIIVISLVCSHLLSDTALIPITSFEANFKQVIQSDNNQQLTYTGKLYINHNKQLLWKYKTPIEKNIHMNHTMIIIDEPLLEQAIFRPLNNEFNLIDLLKKAQKMDQHTYETTIQDTTYQLIEQNGLITTIHYKDLFENKTTLYFDKILYNHTINSNLFNFKAPANYDIIRQ